MRGLTRDGTAELVSRDQILRRERGQGNVIFSCSADHEQEWQPYPVDPYYIAVNVMTIHTVLSTSYLWWMWEKQVHINWSMATCQGSTRSKLP